LTAGNRALFAKEGDSAVLVSDDLTLRHLEKANLIGQTDLTKKQLHKVGYIFELSFDLAIPPGSNVSSSPGFEALGFSNT
jgi:hypothetical protein